MMNEYAVARTSERISIRWCRSMWMAGARALWHAISTTAAQPSPIRSRFAPVMFAIA
jgi:hypothetical protein